ncbi:hypothetical protein B0J17DRAFT_531586, partial [Rhizoctonia solani]
RHQLSILTQLCTGHFPTASYLYRLHISESPRCQLCDTHSETVVHLLMGCRTLEGLRQEREIG